jgi:two-component system LytT family response regulator
MGNSIRTILIDDEVSCTETLHIELNQYCPDIEVIQKCNSSKSGLLAIQELKPELVFLDIEMPWMNGFELLQSVSDIDFEVIFVTAYDQFAIKAIKFSAMDYLLKPIQKKELIIAVDSVRKKKKSDKSFEQINLLLEQVQREDGRFAKLALPTMEGLEFVPIGEILYCKSDSNYTHVLKKDGSSTLVSRSLKYISEMMDENTFVRIHQSYLININHIERYLKGQGGEVVMSNGKHLPVSRSKKEDLLSKFR